MSRKRAVTVAQIFLFALILTALVWRALKSVEVTDEIHGVASVLNILEGKRPFTTSWDYHTGWCLVAPFYYAYIALRGGNREGIVLFSRILYLCVSLFALYIAARLCYGHVERAPAALHTPLQQYICLLSLVTYVPFSIFQLNYNAVTAYLSLILLVILQSLQEKNSAHPCLRFASGVIAGLICVSYPPMAALAALLFFIVWLTNQKRGGMQKALFYGLGLSLTALAFLLWILAGDRSVSIFKGLEGMLTSPHQFSRAPATLAFIGFLRNLKRDLFNKPYAFAVFPYIALQFGLALAEKRKRERRVSQENNTLHFIIFILMSVYNELLLYFQTFPGSVGATRYSINAFLAVLVWIWVERGWNLSATAYISREFSRFMSFTASPRTNGIF